MWSRHVVKEIFVDDGWEGKKVRPVKETCGRMGKKWFKMRVAVGGKGGKLKMEERGKV